MNLKENSSCVLNDACGLKSCMFKDIGKLEWVKVIANIKMHLQSHISCQHNDNIH